MDKAVIDELFSEDTEAAKLRHSDEEINAVLEEKAAQSRSALSRIEALRGELASLKDEFEKAAYELQDLYDDLDFSQQSGSGEALSVQAAECARAAEELNNPIDALSDLLLFRFR